MNEREAPSIAARQHGAIKSSQLGLSRAGVAKWVRSGRLHRKYRGVYAYGHPRLSREGEWMAGVLAGGHGAALAGRCATVLLGVGKRTPREVEIIVPGHRRTQPGLRVRTCRNLDPRDLTVVNGIPVTTVARTLVDLADDEDAEDVAHVIHEAAHWGKFDLAATRAALDRANGRRGVKVLEAAIDLHLSGSAGSRSRLEKRFRKLIAGAGLPQPRHNVNVNGFEVDFTWPMVVVEIDGPGHRRARTRVDDAIEDAALRAAGYTVIRFTEADVDHRPEKVLQALTAALGRSARNT
ncbi:type IV toxin-antitoxin system AbiEi family antitoxin domain-containing protein [Solirubrobacter soli]|uniref:type IV toxin-antitoxin system AbiEi family antitoxin domain-containing protein n=1 Tax=Solirubrobacter soli TaxID=363832 RepID=UPI00047F860C|nr:type IV toxin-antitoxin system AbiEi family antitoxin domain-containing protein [Solirubrobacter soli]